MTIYLKEIRLKKGMSQEELAEKAGVSRQTVMCIENNPDYNTTSKTLVSLADALQTTVDRLFLPVKFNH